MNFETPIAAVPRAARPLLGIGLMVAATLFLPTKDGFAKMLGGYYSPLWLLWAQYLFMYAVLAPIIVRQHGWRVLWPRPIGAQFLRGLFIVGAVGFFYWSLRFIPLADATAVSFVGPIITTALSPWLLGEQVGIRRWTAVIVGFAGVMLILRPDLGGERLGYLIALGAGISAGLFYVMNRKLADTTPALVAVTYSAVIGLFIATLVLPFAWVPIRLADGWIIGGFVVFSLIGQSLLVMSFNHGAASIIAPFIYGNILVATLFGFFVFEEFPKELTWVGIAIVVASGIYIAVREGRVKQTKTA